MKNFLLTKGLKSCIVFSNSKTTKCDDREKVLSKTLQRAAGRCEAVGRGGCHWPLSIFAETGGSGGDGLPHRYQRGGIRPGFRTDAGSGHVYANESGTAEAELSSLFKKETEAFFLAPGGADRFPPAFSNPAAGS